MFLLKSLGTNKLKPIKLLQLRKILKIQGDDETDEGRIKVMGEEKK